MTVSARTTSASQNATAGHDDGHRLKKDIITTTISCLALALSLISTWELNCRGADTRISFGPYATFIGSDVVGINCSLSNEGGQQDTINFMTAEIKGDNEVLRSIWTTVSAHQWTLQRQRQEKPTHVTEFADFTSIVVPSKGRDSRVVWFSSDTNYKFQAREYEISVRGYGSHLNDLRTEGKLLISLSEEQKKRIDDSPDLEISVRLKPWVGILR